MKTSIINQCLTIARKNNTPDRHPEFDNFSHFAFIIQDNKIIEWATNKKAEPLILKGYTEAMKRHAEPEAYRKAKGILDKDRHFECLNIRLNKQSQLKLSKPCQCCYRFLSALNCSKVYFSTEVGIAEIRL